MRRLRGLQPYDGTYLLQRQVRDAVQRGRSPSTILLLEHAPVVTKGRNARPEHLLLSDPEFAARGIAVRQADRGGDVTYHGPGQLVAYPILDLSLWRRSIRWYLRTLEDVLIRQLEAYGLRAERLSGLTGVWVDGAKVAAIGVGIHRWVTFHGIALNVCPDLDQFATIVPCGIQDRPVTSLDRLLPAPPSLDTAARDLVRSFGEVFVCAVEPAAL